MGRVSIHAPREGCDTAGRRSHASRRRFNSRTPGGVRLLRDELMRRFGVVSIHAPREGCDIVAIKLHRKIEDVSIHAPREGCDTPLFGY